jgi:putative transposase
MLRSYRIEIKPNKAQRLQCSKSAGTARYAYNWKLAQLKESYEQWKELDNPSIPKPHFGSAIDWHKEWVLFKQMPENKWIYESSKCCGQEALRNLESAYKRFFKGLGKYPRFKKKGNNDSFRLTGSISINNDYVKIPNIGKVKLKEKGYAVCENTKLSQITVSCQAGHWFVSFLLKNEGMEQPKPNIADIAESDILGVDLGCKDLAITSDAEVFSNPKAYRKRLKKLKRMSRWLSKKQKGSSNRRKAKYKLAKIHKKIGDIRKDTTHKMTTSLAKAKPKMIVIESLKPRNMAKNCKLAISVNDSAFGMIAQQFTYKCEWNGIHLVKADPFYASSKYCSHCGHKYAELSLGERQWTCTHCGTRHDRDFNAAMNLQYYGLWLLGLTNTVSSTGIDACGDERLQFLAERCLSVKQELKTLYKIAC